MDENVRSLLKGLDLPTLENKVFPIYRRVLDKKIAELSKDILKTRIQFKNAMGADISSAYNLILSLLDVKAELKAKGSIITPRIESPMDIIDVCYTPIAHGYIDSSEILKINKALATLSNVSPKKRTSQKLVCCLVGANGMFSIVISNVERGGSTAYRHTIDSTPHDFAFKMGKSFGSFRLTKGVYDITVYYEGVARFRNRGHEIDTFVQIDQILDPDLFDRVNEIASK